MHFYFALSCVLFNSFPIAIRRLPNSRIYVTLVTPLAETVVNSLMNQMVGVEPYSKCPFSNHQSQQRIQILGYHISVDAVIRDEIFNTQNNEFFNWRKNIVKKLYRKRKRKPPHNISVLLKIVFCWKGVFCMVLREMVSLLIHLFNLLTSQYWEELQNEMIKFWIHYFPTFWGFTDYLFFYVFSHGRGKTRVQI